ncbi:virion structural protein [Rhizobium phage RHEph06]|uniref:Uncharacterized protein n=2 Tax=Kleczkowskavirus RHEph4 TaxID=1921526 RepID=L7TJK9_9CAUD|nr:virion structural protein [Rhizobium phage RHEph06]YP_009598459.1 virion structural protein [Rhizobium phage RHEph04]AGC35779.1 hypothetical protein RHEph05_gp012 [Rhizobium phage RHEph05]QXV74896.1 hypothetical protein [Rhizobium phage RHEph26]AGC35703.1 hypothetical protein RHEph04_gp017 [Rhizobium phage RHEph04]AGC35860.1 hypothetical protein RHEph06_gp018 [Rhizobium phage RHEph06]
MPNVQSTYTENLRVGVAGQRANMEPVDLISRSVEDVAGLGFGIVVQQGAADKGCTGDLNTAAMDAYKFLGVTMRERGVNPETPNGWAKGESALIMRKGVIWVQVDGAVAAGNDVTVTLATGKLGTKAVAAGIIAIPNARWETSAADLGLAQLRLSN